MHEGRGDLFLAQVFFSTVTFRTSSRIITPCLGLSMVTVEILGMGLDCFPKFPLTFPADFQNA